VTQPRKKTKAAKPKAAKPNAKPASDKAAPAEESVAAPVASLYARRARR
jgi:hypothetical protein